MMTKATIHVPGLKVTVPLAADALPRDLVPREGPPGEPTLRPSWNLTRLSRGKMHGVDHNKDLTWVGSSIGLWRA